MFEFTQFPPIFSIFFLIFIIIFGINIFMMVKEWFQNNESPRLCVEATIVDKHKDVHVHHHMNNQTPTHTTSSTYYVTFEVESKDRMVFKVKRSEYGLLAVGDQGKLHFQGTRYLAFDRNRT